MEINRLVAIEYGPNDSFSTNDIKIIYNSFSYISIFKLYLNIDMLFMLK